MAGARRRGGRALRLGLWAAAPSAAVVSLFDGGAALAQVPATPGALDTMIAAFRRVQQFEGALGSAAQNLFGVLAGMELAWALWRARHGDVPDLIGVVVERAVILGFFWFILINGGGAARAIIDTLVLVSNDAVTSIGGTSNLGPTDMFGVGMNIATSVWKGLTVYSPVQSFLLTLAGFFVLGAMIGVTAMMIEVIVIGYFVASAGVFFLGLGGSWWTRDFAVNVLKLALAIGAQRMFIQLLVGLTETLMRDLARQVEAGGSLNLAQLAVLVGVPGILCWLCKTLPQRAERFIQGSTVGGGGLTSEIQRQLQAAISTGISVGASGAATAAAVRAATTQIDARAVASGGAAPAGAARMAQIAGQAVRNLRDASAAEVGQRLGGGVSTRNGYAGARVASALNRQGDAAAGTLRAHQQQQGPPAAV